MFRLKYSLTKSIPVASFRLFSIQNLNKIPMKKKSGNEIKLIGRVNDRTLQLENGLTSFLITTAIKGNETIHRLKHSIKAKLDASMPALIDNDLVYIVGEIVYEQRKNGDKVVTVPKILSEKVVLLENNPALDDDELRVTESANEVKLLGTISGRISDLNATVFSIYTNANLPSSFNTTKYAGNWHRVVILDNGLREFVRKNVKEKDHMLINGEISYRKMTLKDGTLAKTGSIMAKRIQIIPLFRKSEKFNPQNTKNHEATVEQSN